MHELIAANVAKSLHRLVGNEAWEPSQEEQALPHMFSFLGLPPTPIGVAISKEGCLRSPQAPIFGFYALRNIVRSILLGARPFEAGNLLLSRGFLAAAVASYYTSAFHLLSGLLALNGRVWFDEVAVLSSVKKENIECAVGRLTRSNSWLIERRSRSHGRKWAELGQACEESKGLVDNRFVDLLSGLVNYGPYPFGDEKTVLSDSLRRVAELRHAALYQGFGFDEFAFDLASENGDRVVLSQRATSFRGFVRHLMGVVLDGFETLIARSTASTLVMIRPMLLMSVYAPPFEVTLAEGIEDDALADKVRVVRSWMLGEQALNPSLHQATGVAPIRR